MEEKTEQKRYLHIEFDERRMHRAEACMDRCDALVLITGLMLEFDLTPREVERAFGIAKVVRRETEGR